MHCIWSICSDGSHFQFYIGLFKGQFSLEASFSATTKRRESQPQSHCHQTSPPLWPTAVQQQTRCLNVARTNWVFSDTLTQTHIPTYFPRIAIDEKSWTTVRINKLPNRGGNRQLEKKQQQQGLPSQLPSKPIWSAWTAICQNWRVPGFCWQHPLVKTVRYHLMQAENTSHVWIMIITSFYVTANPSRVWVMSTARFYINNKWPPALRIPSCFATRGKMFCSKNWQGKWHDWGPDKKTGRINYSLNDLRPFEH